MISFLDRDRSLLLVPSYPNPSCQAAETSSLPMDYNFRVTLSKFGLFFQWTRKISNNIHRLSTSLSRQYEGNLDNLLIGLPWVIVISTNFFLSKFSHIFVIFLNQRLSSIIYTHKAEYKPLFLGYKCNFPKWSTGRGLTWLMIWLLNQQE